MRVTGTRVALCCALLAIAAMAIPSLAGAKVKKVKVDTTATLNAVEEQGRQVRFSGFLDVDPGRKTCLRREVSLIEIREVEPKVVDVVNSNSEGRFDFGEVNTKRDAVYQAEVSKKKKTKKKKGKKKKKIVCKPTVSNSHSF